MQHILKLLKQNQFIVILSVIIINKIQEFNIDLLQINHLVVYQKLKIVYLKSFNSEFETIEVWFIDQKSQLLEIEDKIDLTLVIK